MIYITEDEVKGFGFKNPNKLVEIINDLSNAIFRHSKVPASYIGLGELELSDECKFELAFMEYEDMIVNILKKYCS